MSLSNGERWPDVLNLFGNSGGTYNNPDTLMLTITPEALYTKGRDHLIGRMRNPNLPDDPLSNYYRMAKSLPVTIWDRLQIEVFEETDLDAMGEPVKVLRSHPEKLDPQLREIRRVALESIRLWVTELLHRALEEQTMTVHIGPKDLRYKL